MGDAMNHNKNKGFTLIELMAVISIISILAVIALAVYGDYIVRSKVSEGMVFAGEAKTSVTEYYYDRKVMPADNNAAGLALASLYGQNFQYIRRLEISSTPTPGTITVTFKVIGNKADGKELQLIPSTMDGLVSWTCRPSVENGLDTNQAPPNCRG